MAALRHPDVGVIALRLMHPMSEAQFKGNEYRRDRRWHPLGPNDTRRLFLAAAECTRHPGFHLVQATGDLGGDLYPNTLAERVLGWKAEGN